MRPFPLINPHGVFTSALGRIEPETDERDRIFESVKGVVIRVYPIGHPENGLHRTLVDVHCGYLLPIFNKVPVHSPHAHQETEIALPDTRFRNPYLPKPRNRIEGLAYDLRPGTLVWVQFHNGDFHDPVVVGTATPSFQGDEGFPFDKHSSHPFNEAGDDVEVKERFALDSDMLEYPRAVESFNGTRREIDKRGNINVQTTIDKLPVFPGDNQILASELPEGSYVISTKGATKGNIGHFTGIHDLTGETNLQGNHVDESKLAGIGSHIRRILYNVVGKRLLSILGNIIGSSLIEIRTNGQGNYELELTTNGLGNWRALISANGSGNWDVTVTANSSGNRILNVSGNGSGNDQETVNGNGSGNVTRDINGNGGGLYAVRSAGNGNGAHVHSSTSDGDGHMERTIESGGVGSILDDIMNSGVGLARRTTKNSGDGSILDKTELGGKGRIDRQTLSSTDGAIRDQTDSPLGHIVHQTKAQSKGWHWTSSREAIEGKIYVEDRERKGYWFLDPDLGLFEAYAELKNVLNCDDVRLGSRGAPHNIVLWPQLDIIMQFLTNIHDTHVHPGVTVGFVSTEAPAPVQLPYWLANGPNCRSDVVRADKDPSSEPVFQDDPDEGAPA